MTDDILYSLWFSECLMFYAKKRDLLGTFLSPKEIFLSDDEKLKEVFNEPLYTKLIGKDLSRALKIYSDCEKYGIKILTPRMENYPKKLLSLSDYPETLFVRGDVYCLNSELSVAVIGSRTSSKYGEDVAEEIAYSLSKSGALIVSGGALGIDSVAHRSAISAGGKTVLVMGCGHGFNYLPQNSDLRKAVYQNGALLSEYPPFYPPSAGSFPQRNRLISGLSDGTVIVEAALKSGSLNTASHAKKQGRKVFALPGDVKSGSYDGSNELIKNGAIPVFSSEDVMENLDYKSGKISYSDFSRNLTEPFSGIDEDGENSKNIIKAQRKKKEAFEEKTAEEKTKVKKEKNFSSDYAKAVYEVMEKGNLFRDDIIRNSNLETKTVIAGLTELELFGFIKTVSPNEYKLT